VLASSNFWLGISAGLFIHRVGDLIGIGTVGFMALAIATARSETSSRTAFLKIISGFLIYTISLFFPATGNLSAPVRISYRLPQFISPWRAEPVLPWKWVPWLWIQPLGNFFVAYLA
jgi:hypothetical protein